MTAGDLFLATFVLAIPIALGVALGRVGRPWWWGGLVFGGLGLVISATDPEEGFVSGKHDHFPEFFLLCTVVMVGLVAAGAVLGRRWRASKIATMGGPAGLVCLLALIVVQPAAAAVQKAVFTEDSTGVTPMSAEDGLAGCIGYTGDVFEARHGVWKITVGKRDGHVEGVVRATLRISPIRGHAGVTYTGSYVEHDVGRFTLGPGGDLPSPNAMFQLRATARGDDGSLLRFHEIGQTHVDLRTGDVRRDRYTLRCTVS